MSASRRLSVARRCSKGRTGCKTVPAVEAGSGRGFAAWIDFPKNGAMRSAPFGALRAGFEVVPFQNDERPPQGLKPNHFWAVCGPAKAVPFYKAAAFRGLKAPAPSGKCRSAARLKQCPFKTTKGHLRG